MTDNPMWLALGAFVTSSGFGGLAALFAAGIAYLGLLRRVREDRATAVEVADRAAEDAVESDARERWWQLLEWLYDHKKEANDYDPFIAARTLHVLEDLASTRHQLAMLEIVGPLVLVPEALEVHEVEDTDQDA